MLTWKTSTPPELKLLQYKHDPEQGPVKLILDGQQRITTLYMLIQGTIPPYYSKQEITHDIRGLYVHVKTLELSYYQPVRMGNDPCWIDITEIFQNKIRSVKLVKKLRDQGQSLDEEEEDQIDDNLQKIKQVLNREFREQIIPGDATIGKAIDIFYKVNASGITLTEADLALAHICGYWPKARHEFEQKLDELKKSGFAFKPDFLVYVLLGCLYYIGSDTKRLHGEENKESIQRTWKILNEETLDYVVNFLRERAYVDHLTEVGTVNAIIPIIVFFYKHRKQTISEEQRQCIVKWFYYTQLRARYASQTLSKLDQDLKIIRDSDKPFEEMLVRFKDEYRLEISPDEFAGRNIRNPLFRLMRWYFKKQNATCFTTGLPLRNNFGMKYQLEHDHIFPTSHLQKAGYSQNNHHKYALAQELTNRAILTQLANRQKSARPAKEYLSEIRDKHPGALEKQCIPVDEQLWEVERYEDFLQARRKLLATQLNHFLDELTTPDEEDVAGAITIEERIASGENAELEFKSSLRWDYRIGEVNKILETVAMKTIAAFTNSNGGTLLIGIDDDGAPIGLENDYASLNGDKDEFEIHLRQLLNNNFGPAFVTTHVTVNFPNTEDTEICQIDVSRATELKWTTYKDKYGEEQKKLYVRNGNSSQELTGEELSSYIQQRS